MPRLKFRPRRTTYLPTVNLFGLYQQIGISGASTTTTSTRTGFASVLTEPILFANGTPVTIGTPAVPIFVGAQTVNSVHNAAQCRPARYLGQHDP